MNIEKWKKLSKEEQIEQCKSLNPYEDWVFFKEIEKEFELAYGSQEGVARVFCGFGSSLGTYHGIFVSIDKGKKRANLPKQFMGFLVERKYAQ